MPELKIDFKNLGAIRLMPLDTTDMFLPFGRPIGDYLRGLAGNQNGTRALLKQGSIEFLPRIGWTEGASGVLRTTGFGELEREGMVESEGGPAEPADPGMADFLPFGLPGPSAKGSSQTKLAAAVATEDFPISKPRISALPLRPRMTFGPAPAAKTKPAPAAAPAPKPVAVPPVVKASPTVVAVPKPSPAPAAKPPLPVTPVKVISPAAVQPKPVTVIPPAPKPVIAPAGAPRAAVPQTSAPVAMPRPVPAPVSPKAAPAAPAARAPEQNAPKAAPGPRIQPAVVSALDSATPAPPPAAKLPAPPPAKPASAIVISPKPPLPPPAPRPVEPAPASEAVSREAPKEAEPVSFGSTFEPHLSMGTEAESGSFLSKIPLAMKIGIAVVLLIVAVYFIFGRSESASSGGGQAVAVGEQGWSTEWASDAAGSRRGRQLTLYRPSVGMSDYQLQFVGQIESKALGWVFRESDTKNYYGMKIANIRPGAMAIAHFAVVEGRQSSDSEKPVGIDARPGAAYRVKLDVSGPRFTLYIEGEPVDFWTDNRLKTGAVGFMNERDERGATSSVQFSFAKGAK